MFTYRLVDVAVLEKNPGMHSFMKQALFYPLQSMLIDSKSIKRFKSCLAGLGLSWKCHQTLNNAITLLDKVFNEHYNGYSFALHFLCRLSCCLLCVCLVVLLLWACHRNVCKRRNKCIKEVQILFIRT